MSSHTARQVPMIDAETLMLLRSLRRHWRSFSVEFHMWLHTVNVDTPRDEARRMVLEERDRSRIDPALMSKGRAVAGWVLLNPLLERQLNDTPDRPA